MARNNPLRSFTLTPERDARLADESSAWKTSKSGVVGIGIDLLSTRHQAAAIERASLCAVLDFGRNAALGVTARGSVVLGDLRYDGRSEERDDEGLLVFGERGSWDFADGPWVTRSWRGREAWTIALTVTTGDAGTSDVGFQITSGQGVSPLGYPPYIWLAGGTHAAERGSDHLPLAAWDWADRCQLADSAGIPLAEPLPRFDP